MIEDDDSMRIIKEAMEHISAAGVTSVSDMTGYDCDEDYPLKMYKMMKDFEQEDEMTLRLHVYPKLFDQKNYDVALDLKKRFDSEKFKIAGLKGFLDGALSH